MSYQITIKMPRKEDASTEIDIEQSSIWNFM